MTYALVYRYSKKSIYTLALLLAAFVFTALLIQIFDSIVAVAVFLIFIYIAFRLPLIVLAKSVEKVEVEKIAEVEMSLKEVFKALLSSSKSYLLFFLALLFLTLLVLVLKPLYTTLPLNLLLITFVVPITGNTRVIVCKEGVVDGRLVLNRWEDFAGIEEKDEWVILKRRFDFPIVLPEDTWVKLKMVEVKSSPSRRANISASHRP
ncbi:hypothetical protein [Ferroglobus sp.]|uniref:hypothetical protein n=1 Tax=Ferroglobus sp. TaxID=2614230 RepID=UPI0025C6BB88|nr:hypothetical protein [Ferroglobus sp.]